MFILREWKSKEGEHYLECQLWTACCKKKILVRVDGPSNYFWVDRLDKCSPSISLDINNALKLWREKNKEPII